MEGGQGGRWGGGAPESSVGATKRALVPCFGLPLTTGLIWLVDEGGGMGGGVGRWPMEGGQGGRLGGGHQRAVWEQQNVHWFPLLGSLKT